MNKKQWPAAVLAISLAWMGGMAAQAAPQKDITGSIMGILGNNNKAKTAGNVLNSVLGTDKVTERNLIATWTYDEPGVAFTSNNVLAKAGGELAAAQAKDKLKSYFQQAGIQQSNTQFTFTNDKKFKGKLYGQSFNGTWTFNSKTQQVVLKTMLLTVPVYVKKTATGMSFLFESQKLLALAQKVAKLSGNEALQTLGTLGQNYDGIRMGFDMKK